MLPEILAGIGRRLHRESPPPLSISDKKAKDPLSVSVELSAWWLEWPGHPGIVHPRYWVTDPWEYEGLLGVSQP